MGFPSPPRVAGGSGGTRGRNPITELRPPIKPPLSMGFSKIPSKATPWGPTFRGDAGGGLGKEKKRKKENYLASTRIPPLQFGKRWAA